MKIFVTRKIPGDHLKKLSEKGFEVEISELDRPLSSEELIEKAKGVDALLCMLFDKIDGEVIDAIGPQLKIVSNYAVGFDNINLFQATEKGVVVANTPSDAVNEAVAEHTWNLILAISRRVVEADEYVRQGLYKGWAPELFLGHSILGKTLGIVGLGRIGSMVARRAHGYNLKVLYTKHTPDPKAEKELGVTFVTLDTLLAESDFVSLHVPLSDETHGMMDADTIFKMKKGAFLINTARGPVVDERALVEALSVGHLGGAALDVYENEPHISKELLAMTNVIATPHIASATVEARDEMGNQAVQAIIDVFSEKCPANIVDKNVWEKRRK